VSPIAAALKALSAEVARLTAALGRRVDALGLGITDRAGQLKLRAPGIASANRACRLFRASDGWFAVNLARDEDRELTPAWMRSERISDPWRLIAEESAGRTVADLIADATLLGLPAAGVGEVVCESFAAPTLPLGAPGRPAGPLRVLDLSALWAGPMCGAILGEMGAEVTKLESSRRLDPTAQSTPEFFRRLNGRKSLRQLDFQTADGRAALREAILAADVVITSARPRAFVGLGLEPEAIFAAKPQLTWVAITGYGWSGRGAERVAFGDDAAAAGGLVRWTRTGEPRFLGDALADPVTGLAAAIGALSAIVAGGGVLVDIAMARCAAAAAALRARAA